MNTAVYLLLLIMRAGNFHDSLSDAKTAIDLQPSNVNAIVRGKSNLGNDKKLCCHSDER